jgi:hypothetical protein
MKVEINRPDGYSLGAYRAEVRLEQNEAALIHQFDGFGFEIPKMQKRLVLSDDGFQLVAPCKSGGFELRMKFVDSVWRGHVYSNGVSEESNPTAIGTVADEIAYAVKSGLDLLAEWKALKSS